ncbi:hypothetical protein CKO41_10515 [Thiococcus pfennigii]|nr:hypothetical protein [Thiococcus pfennigii]MBK1732213.1 hypothetical protein [Thiococcus pfennigii]
MGHCLSWILPALLVAMPAAATADDPLDASLARCARIADPPARLACFDALAARESVPLGSTTPPPSAPLTALPAPADAAPPAERTALRARFGVLPYRHNYVLPITYNARPNRDVAADAGVDEPVLGDEQDQAELEFQISFEIPLWTEILDRDLDLYFAYTQRSFLQAYNGDQSAPFRESSYEPEFGLHWATDLPVLGWRIDSLRLALNHQSNGRSDPLSRGWNRAIGQVEARRNDWELALRLWAPFDDAPDDNPDITDYLGYGEIHVGYELAKHRLGLMLRNPRHLTTQIDWSYPLGDTLRLYVQYFNGYGESLIDYDHSVNRIGAGLMLNDWPW